MSKIGLTVAQIGVPDERGFYNIELRHGRDGVRLYGELDCGYTDAVEAFKDGKFVELCIPNEGGNKKLAELKAELETARAECRRLGGGT